MVRQVQVDDEIPKFAESLVANRRPAEIGVLVGRAATGKDFVLQLVTCPGQEGSAPITAKESTAQKAGGVKGKAQQAAALTLDADWIVEHAAQVSRLLPGGLDVLGVYVFCPEAALAPSSGKLTALLKDIQREVAGGVRDLLVLHIDSTTGKCAAKELSGTSLKPCEVKPSSLVSNMAEVRCVYPIALKVHCAPGKQALHEALSKAVHWENQQRLNHSVALVSGAIPPSSKAVAELQADGATGAIEMELVCNATTSAPAVVGMPNAGLLQRGKGQYTSSGELELSGCLDCRAFVHKRETAAAAVGALKNDIVRSLKVRIDVVIEAAEAAAAIAEPAASSTGAASTEQQHPLMMPVTDTKGKVRSALPRRAFVSWRQGQGRYCDYLMEGESPTSAVGRLQELLGQGSLSDVPVECREEVACGPNGIGSKTRSGAAGGALACNVMAVVASSVAGLAALVGYMSLES